METLRVMGMLAWHAATVKIITVQRMNEGENSPDQKVLCPLRATR